MASVPVTSLAFSSASPFSPEPALGSWNRFDDPPVPDLTPYDIMLGCPVPVCPPPNSTMKLFTDSSRDTAFLSSGIVCSLAVFFAIFVGVRYNSVRVFNRLIRTPSLSNTWWCWYFGAIALRSLADGFRWSPLTDSPTGQKVLQVISVVGASFASLFLAFALKHQFRHRSSVDGPSAKAESAAESSPLLGDENRGFMNSSLRASSSKMTAQEWLKVNFFSLGSLFILLFILHLVFIYVTAAEDLQFDSLVYLYLSSTAVLRIPPLVFGLIIGCSRLHPSGPTLSSKLLIIACTLIDTLSNVLSPEIFNRFVQDCTATCDLGGWASGSELLIWGQGVSIIAYFIFVKVEFERTMEEYMWTVLAQIQDTFDVRRY